MPHALLGDNSLNYFEWCGAIRIIASRFPPIDLFERVSGDPGVWDALMLAEQMTNPRLRNEAGDISLVPPEDRVFGTGASWVMASFTHINPKGSRFSDGTYGILYAGKEFETALRETIYHFEEFCRDSKDGPRYEDMRVLIYHVKADLRTVAALSDEWMGKLLDPDDYTEGRKAGREIKAANGYGIHYPSVRRKEGECVAIFRPPAIQLPVMQARHLQYHWDGRRVSKYYDYGIEEWVVM